LPSLDDLIKRQHDAYQKATGAIASIRDLNDYAMPGRNPKSVNGGKNKDRYDPTLQNAAFRFSGRMTQTVIPEHQKNFELKSGPLLPATGDQKKEIDTFLEETTAIVQSVFDGSNLSIAAGEMFLDYFGGTGALLMVRDKNAILKFVSVPVVELALEENSLGELIGWHWTKEIRGEEILQTWPDGRFSEHRKKQMKEKPSDKHKVCQSTVFEAKSGKFVTRVFFVEKEANDNVVHDQKEDYSPWVTPRFYKRPGDPYGVGLGTLALPSAKTADRIVELTLRAALFSVMGLWMYRDDRVFNPRKARMVPGAMWKVSSTGGTMGPGIQKLDVPGRLDVAHVSLKELREMIREITLDNALPPAEGAVRSATEIVERLKRLAQDLGGVYGRLSLEFIRPLVQYTISVLHERGMIKAKFRIDELVTKIQITSPVARGQQAEAVSQIIQWLEMIIAINGPDKVELFAATEVVFPEIGRMLGVSEKFIRSETEREKILEKIAQMIAAQNQAQNTEAA
jgi:hypothetical protein